MIRKARVTDMLRCQDIIYACSYVGQRKREYIIKNRNWYSLKNIEKFIKNSYFIVYEKNKKVLATGRIDKDHIYTIYVDPAHHKKGIGSKIMKKLISHAKKNRMKSVRLDARKSATGFYKKLGFMVIDKKENIMEKTL